MGSNSPDNLVGPRTSARAAKVYVCQECNVLVDSGNDKPNKCAKGHKTQLVSGFFGSLIFCTVFSFLAWEFIYLITPRQPTPLMLIAAAGSFDSLSNWITGFAILGPLLYAPAIAAIIGVRVLSKGTPARKLAGQNFGMALGGYTGFFPMLLLHFRH